MTTRQLRYTTSLLVIAAWLFCFLGLPLVDSAWGIETKKTTPAAPKAISKNKPPEPQDEIFDTADGVRLHATFYPGMKEKNSVPVILIHGLQSNRKGYHDLALFLQKRGCAVLAPDLRGHGESLRAKNLQHAIDPNRMGVQQFQAIPGPQGDIEACKKFLIGKNNKGELNIEKLCIIGAGFGAVAAVNWATLDWSWPPLTTGKQGQDAKALVLISPVWSSRGLPLRPATNSEAFRSVFSTMILVGRDDKKSCKCSDSLAKIIERFNPDANAEDPKDRSFFYYQLDTSLKGMKMLDEASLKVHERIAKFIKLRLVDQSILWKERKKAF